MRIFLCCISLVFLSSTGYSQIERQFQFWNLNKGIVHISDDFDVEAAEKVHYNLHTGKVDYRYGQLALSHQINSWIELTGGLGYYRYHRTQF